MATSCNIAQHGVQTNATWRAQHVGAKCCAQHVGTTCCVRLHTGLKVSHQCGFFVIKFIELQNDLLHWPQLKGC